MEDAFGMRHQTVTTEETDRDAARRKRQRESMKRLRDENARKLREAGKTRRPPGRPPDGHVWDGRYYVPDVSYWSASSLMAQPPPQHQQHPQPPPQSRCSACDSVAAPVATTIAGESPIFVSK